MLDKRVDCKILVIRLMRFGITPISFWKKNVDMCYYKAVRTAEAGEVSASTTFLPKWAWLCLRKRLLSRCFLAEVKMALMLESKGEL